MKMAQRDRLEADADRVVCSLVKKPGGADDSLTVDGRRGDTGSDANHRSRGHGRFRVSSAQFLETTRLMPISTRRLR
jgi:hypothetical protein